MLNEERKKLCHWNNRLMFYHGKRLQILNTIAIKLLDIFVFKRKLLSFQAISMNFFQLRESEFERSKHTY